MRFNLILIGLLSLGSTAHAQTYGTYYAYPPPCLSGAAQSGSQCIGTVAPAVPPAPAVTAPTGTITTDGASISGTGETSDTLQVWLDGQPQGSVTVANGVWSLTPAIMSNGSHTVTAQQTNPANVTGPTSAPLTFTVNISVPAGTTYQFALSGSDSNDCKSAPCQTLTKASALHYLRGDAIRFHSGDSFLGQLVLDWTVGSGNVVSALDHPISVDVYGGTAPATITASGTSGASAATIRLISPNGITWRNVNLTGNTGGIARGFSFENPALVLAPGGVDIGNVETIGFWDGTDANFGAHAFYQGYPGAGIGTITMHDWKCHGASGINSYDDSCFNGYGNGVNLQSLEIYNLKAWNIGGHPGVFNGQGGNGVQCNGVVWCYVHNFVVHDIAGNMNNCGGPYGAWAANTTKYRFAYGEVYNVHSTVGGGCDRGGFDGDNNSVTGAIDHVFVHDTDGPCILDFESGDGGGHHINANEVICANTGQIGYSAVHLQGAHSNSSVLISNSTLVTTGNEQGIGAAQSSGCPALSVIDNAVYAQGAGKLVHLDWIGGGDIHASTSTIQDFYCPGIFFANNGYFGPSPSWQLEGWFDVDTQTWLSGIYPTTLAGWQKFIHGEVGGLLADPLFVGPINNGTHCTDETSATLGPQPCPTGYKLQPLSPYLGAGINPWAPTVAATNYWLSPLFNIGAQ